LGGGADAIRIGNAFIGISFTIASADWAIILGADFRFHAADTGCIRRPAYIANVAMAIFLRFIA